MSPRRIFAVLGGLAALIALGTFRILTPQEGAERTTRDGSTNAYAFDPASGETRASVTGQDGTVTRLHSGQTVAPRLPAGFTQFPDAEVVEHHRVERGAGSRTFLVMTTARPVREVADFYRGQAAAAGVKLVADLASPHAVTLAGRTASGLDFAFTARREGDRTRAQLTVGEGL